MAKLPGYDSTRQMTTEAPAVRRDIEAEGQMGRNLQVIGKAAVDVANVWQAAEDFSQTLTQQNNMDQRVADVLARAEQDPDYNNSRSYYADLDKIREDSLTGFSNNQAQLEFSKTVGATIGAARIKVDGLFREKMVDHTKSELVKSHDINRKNFIATGDPSFQERQRQAVLAANQKGFVNEVFVANEGIKIDEWNNLRYLQMAAEGKVTEAIDMIKASAMTPTDKSAAINSIQQIAKQRTIEVEIENINRQQQWIGESREVVKDQNKTYVDKLDYLQQQKKFGMEDADLMIKYLNSDNRITAKHHDEQMAATLLQIGQISKGVDKKNKVKDLKELLTDVRNTKKYIIGERIAGRLTQTDEDELIAALDKAADEKTKISVERLKKPLSMFHYGYNNAHDDFMILFNGNRTMADAALVEYFHRSEDKKLNDADGKKLAAQVVEIIRDGERKRITDELTQSIRPPENLSEAEIMKRAGITEEDIKYNMETYGVSRQEVINRARGRVNGR